jgi:Nif-specific regulatory protein
MDPKLLAIAGPLQNKAFTFSSGEIAIGRDTANLLSIPDASLSRRHCLIRREGDDWFIEDLESRNGTFVNGQVVKQVRLQHGDKIAVGDSVFRFVTREDDAAQPEVEFDDAPTEATLQFRPDDVLFFRPDRPNSQNTSVFLLGNKLNALLEVSRAVHAIRDLSELQECILRELFQLVPAERGAILIGGNGQGTFASTFSLDRAGSANTPIKVSRTVTKRVVEEGIAILASDVPAGEFNTVDSIAFSQVRSLLCVPLSVLDRAIGCLYVDTRNPAAPFRQEHLELAAAVAGISAMALENARHLTWLEQENQRLAMEVHLDHNLVGDSTKMRDVIRLLSRVAPTDSTVLIEGESGTGKELAARAIHRNSPRANKPFVAINCAAIPEALLESELFGHEKGAFTGAITQRKGRLEIANQGVVFLDEIAELAPQLQAKLLRVLQEREIERVGGSRPIPVDIRLLAATNRNLHEEVKAGKFRQDLYYRLNVVSLRMPPLRERRADIPMLAEYFLSKHVNRFNLKRKVIAPDAMACLVSYDWPGNVRELENTIERALVLSVGDLIRPEDVPGGESPKSILQGGPVPKYQIAVRELKEQLIFTALEQAKWNYTEAAHLLGIHPNYLHRLIRNLELRKRFKATV